jgi:hypothetical protein
MKQLLTTKEKFLKAIELNYIHRLDEIKIVNACTKILIEEKIELLDKLKKWIIEIENSVFALSAPSNELKMLVNFKDKLNKEITELTNELKQLSK